MNFDFQIIPNCTGHNAKQNDLIYVGRPGVPSANVVFFGGDVQNYLSAMTQNSFNQSYSKWNLEHVSQLLFRRLVQNQTSFKSPHLWTIRASRWINQTLACYDHFLPFTVSGLPDLDSPSTSEPKAWEQLSHLLRNSAERLNLVLPGFESNLDVPLHIIGFSKGGCVVTKLFYELSTCSGFSNVHDEQMFALSNDTARLVSNLTDMYWLDTGHSGRNHQWPTSEHYISSIRPMSCPKLHVEATPYQIMNNQFPWKSQDFNTFIHLLSKYSLPFKKTIHFASDSCRTCNLDTHFEILNQFDLTSF